MALLTVAEVVQTVISPLGGEPVVLGGTAGLGRDVIWTATARPSSPIFAGVKAGELALASAPNLRLLDPPANLALLIDWLAERGAAGLLLRGPLRGAAERADAIRAADTQGLPLVVVGEFAHLGDLERAITSLVRERGDEFASRVARLQEVQFQLAAGAPGGRAPSPETIVQTLAGLLRAPAALTGPPPGLDLRYLASATPAGTAATGALAEVWAAAAEPVLQAWQAPGALANARPAEPPVLLRAAGAGRTLLAAPVLVRGRPAAALLACLDTPPNAIDTQTLARAAGICALELARHQAVAVAETRAEQRLRGEFVTDLLHYTPGSGEEVLLGRARALGVDLAPGYAVALLSTHPAPAAEPDATADERLEAALQAVLPTVREPRTLFHVLAGRLALLWPLAARGAGATQEPPERLLQLAGELRDRLAGPGGPASGGVGRGYLGLGSAARSRQEAELALWAAWHLFGGGRCCTYGELGIYRLLLPLREGHHPELRVFYDETLGALERGAGGNGDGRGKLLDTLDAFLAHGGNSTDAARALHLHRNTLSYRLHRIADITGLDLDDPAVRLRVQVALAVRRLLQA